MPNSLPTLTVEKAFGLQKELNFTEKRSCAFLRFDRRNFTRGFVPPYLPCTMQVKRCIFSDLLVSSIMPMEQRKRQLSEIVIVHCTDVLVLLVVK